MSVETTFYIVRHGQTQWNVERRMQGHSNSRLTKQGILDAKLLADHLQGVQFDHAFSSDLFRAKRTAKIITADRNLAIRTKKALREGYFGTYEGKTHSEYDTELKDAIAVRESLSDTDRFSHSMGHDIETLESMVTRFFTFIREVAVAYQGKNILVVTHGGMMRAILVRLGYGSFNEIPHGVIKNLSYFLLITDGIDFKVGETHNIEIEREKEPTFPLPSEPSDQ